MLTGHTLVAGGAKALDVLGYRRMLRVEWSLHRDVPEVELRPGVRVELASLEDFATLRHPTPMAEAERRCAGGERILGLWHEGRLVWASWLATGMVRQPYLRVDLQLSPGEMYQYESWLRPELRGKGLAAQTAIGLIALAQEEGIDRLVIHVWPDNVISLRPVLNNLGRAVGMDMAFRVPGRIVHRYRPWKEPLVGWQQPSGPVGRARHLWHVRYARVRAAQLGG